MAGIASGVAKQVRYKAESNWGEAPAAGSAQLLRFETSDLDLDKEEYESNERVSHYQIVDVRDGVKSVSGSIVGELSPLTYKDFIAAAVRGAWAAVSAITGASITVAGAGPTFTITRAAGSFITDGVKAGQVVRLTAGSFNAANLNKNLFVLSLTATVLTVMPLNGVALVAEGPIAAATVTIPGRKVLAPLTGHTDASFAIEHWHSDIAQSELFLGCKLRELGIRFPAQGMAGITMGFLGKDMTPASAAYYTSPTSETETGILSSSSGILSLQGSQVGLVTGMEFGIAGNHSADPVAFSETYADIAEGRIAVQGRFTALFKDATIRDYFLNGTEVALLMALATSKSALADFISVAMPRVKFRGARKTDGEKSLMLTVPFRALLNVAGGSGTATEETTIAFQDSQVSS